MKYKVKITRLERYEHIDEIEADSEESAIEEAKRRENEGEYAEDWVEECFEIADMKYEIDR